MQITAADPDLSDHRRSGKADFEHIYNRPDPRAYFGTLQRHDYQIPAHAQGVFQRLLEVAGDAHDSPGAVLDLCCSYGVNAALLNHDLDLGDLYERYTSPGVADLSSDALAADDRRFYGARRRLRPVPVVGLDAADRAVGYAERVGLVTEGFDENLEVRDPSVTLRRACRGVGVITVTGGVGYITAATFRRLVGVAARVGRMPWVVVFALRWVDYRPIAEALAAGGLVTETLTERTFRQRRFVDERERDYVLATLRELGVDPAGRETEGYYHANLHVSRPAGSAPDAPLRALLGDAAGVG